MNNFAQLLIKCCNERKTGIMEVFKVDFTSHIKSGWLIILCAIISAIFPYGLSAIKNIDVDSVLWIGPVMFSIFAFPALLVHGNYYAVNQGDVFKYSFDDRDITFIRKGKSTTFSLDDIEYIKRCMTFNLAAK